MPSCRAPQRMHTPSNAPWIRPIFAFPCRCGCLWRSGLRGRGVAAFFGVTSSGALATTKLAAMRRLASGLLVLCMPPTHPLRVTQAITEAPSYRCLRSSFAAATVSPPPPSPPLSPDTLPPARRVTTPAGFFCCCCRRWGGLFWGARGGACVLLRCGFRQEPTFARAAVAAFVLARW